jgi:heme/copper-type cytochrome/quinol oxidase subunit 2
MYFWGLFIPIVIIFVLAGLITYKIKTGKKEEDGNKTEKKSNGGWKWIFIVPIVIISGVIIWNKMDDNIPSLSQEKKPLIWAANPTQVEASDSTWTKLYSLPSGKFRIAVKNGEDAEVLFSNGKYYLLNSDKQIDFGRTSSKAKFRGLNKKVIMQIYSAE